MIKGAKHETETERAAQCMVATALEKLATNLASYLAGGTHQPAENGRQAVVIFLEAMADASFDTEVGEDGDRDEALSRALLRIGEIILRIRAAARL